MIGLGIRYLTGRCAAADASQRAPEWPPHPGRVFMALAAAYFEAPNPDPGERDALLWVERQEPPTIEAVDGDEPREFVEAYVPANDTHGGIVKRPRSARGFASLHVGDEPVFVRWPVDPDPEIRRSLARLCSRVTRIGHSASLVHMWLSEAANGNAAWKPVDFAADGPRLRAVSEGTTEYLAQAFQAGSRPQLTRWQPYQRSQAIPTGGAVAGPFRDKLIVWACESGPALGLETTLQLTSALRNAAMKASPQPPPEWLTGHHPDGRPSRKVHAAFFPLPAVGAEHSDGHILGLAMALPGELPLESFRPVLSRFLFDEDNRDRNLNLHAPAGAANDRRYWQWEVSRETRSYPPQALRAATWTAPSREWASVTPVVLHHYPKLKRDGEVERIVREAFASALLPEPESIRVHAGSVFRGAGHALALPPFTEGGEALCRYQTHVRVRFSNPVQGPVLVGRGRFRGYGLFRPLPEGAA